MIADAVVIATYNMFMGKLTDTGNNMLEIVSLLETENHYMKYMVMARRLDANRSPANAQKKRALYLSTEVIQKTKLYGQNQKAMTFHQLAQRSTKIGGPIINMAFGMKNMGNFSNMKGGETLSANRDRSLPSVSGASTAKSSRKTPKGRSNSQESVFVSQYQSFLKTRKELGEQFSKLSKFKTKLLGNLSSNLAGEDDQFNMQITRPTISAHYLKKYRYRVNQLNKSTSNGAKSMNQQALRNNIRQTLGHTNLEGDENSFRDVLNDINDISLVNRRRNRRGEPETEVEGDLPELTYYGDKTETGIEPQGREAARKLSSILKKRNISISDIKVPSKGQTYIIGDAMRSSSSISKMSKSALFKIKEQKQG